MQDIKKRLHIQVFNKQLQIQVFKKQLHAQVLKKQKFFLHSAVPCAIIFKRFVTMPQMAQSRQPMIGVNIMKEGIHPNYKPTVIKCACGAVYETGSTKQNISVEICSKCHPFYTGKQKLVDTSGRVDKFNKKYGIK